MRMANFEKLRISLARDEDLPVLKAAGHSSDHRSRREFLEAAFAEERVFIHRRTGARFEFSPLPIDGDYVAGIFKRQTTVSLNDSELKSYDAENYEGSVVIISISKDQIVWMQYNSKVGSTKSIIESFFVHLSEKSDVRDWKVYVEYIHNQEEYWVVIKEKKGQIAKIVFTFIPPNALGADDEIYSLVKIVQKEANPDIQQHVYKAKPGKMRPDTEHMNASARIAMQGGGDAEIRDQNNRVLYSSAQARVVREFPADSLPTPSNTTFVRSVRDWLFAK